MRAHLEFVFIFHCMIQSIEMHNKIQDMGALYNFI